MSYLNFFSLMLDLFVAYMSKKNDPAGLRAALLARVNNATQSFSSAVSSGDEDAVSKAISDLLQKVKVNK